MNESADGGRHSRAGGAREEPVRRGTERDPLPALASKAFLAAAPFVVLLALLLAHRWLFR